MEIKRGITDPARGERLLTVFPELAPDVEAEWQRRLNFFQNRALSGNALKSEQLNKAVRINLNGRVLSAGILHGLEVALERIPLVGTSQRTTYRVNTGFGLTALGETVSLSREIQVNSQSVLVTAPPSLLAGGPIISGSGQLLAREISKDSIEQLLANGINLPRAGILLLQPVYTETARGNDPTDPCVNDPSADAFNDLQKVDGARLLWYAWPTEWLPLPVIDSMWRNRLAYQIFRAEALLRGDEMMPWEQFGVPIGVVGHDENFMPIFIDGASVRRAAGKPKRRTTLLPGRGNPFLWQARMEQFAEQVTEELGQGLTPQEISAHMRALPPASLLPIDMISTSLAESVPSGENSATIERIWENQFFPPYHQLEAVPIPLEQLDVALEASASLNHFDMYNAERVRLLVPVPQSVYEPELLRVKVVDPEFQATITNFVGERTKWITRREIVRQILSAHVQALTGEPLEYHHPEATALEDEYDEAGNLIFVENRELVIEEGEPDFYNATVQEKYGISFDLDDDVLVPSLEQIVVREIEELKSFLSGNTPLNPVRPVYLKPLAIENAADLLIPEPLKNKVRYQVFEQRNVARLEFVGKFLDEDKEAFNEFYGRQDAVMDDLRDKVPPEKKDWILNRTTSFQLDKLDELGLEEFILYLEELIDRANDKVDYGFALARTDIYRVRQLVLGTTEASKLATSPTLASIAKGDTAVATKEEIVKFVQETKLKEVTPPPPAEEVAVESSAPETGGADTIRTFAVAAFQPPLSPTSTVFTPALAPTTPLIISTPERFSFRPGVSSASSLITDRFNVKIEAAKERESILKAALPSAALRAPTLEVGATDISHVIGQTAIVGKQNQIRNITVGERLSVQPALESKNNASASIYDSISSFDALEIHTDDLEVVGELDITGQGESDRTRPYFSMIELQRAGFNILLNERDQDDDEGMLFSNAVDVVDRHIAFLRQIEGRVQAYRKALEKCRQTLRTLQQHISLSDQALKNIEDHVAETRHDVAVARALLAEEEERVREINQHRDEIIRNYVKFYAFARPRLSTPTKTNQFAVADLNPALVESPLPACFADDIEPPDELLEMVELWRDVPLQWLKYVRQSIKKIDRPFLLKDAFLSAQTRAKDQISRGFQKQISNKSTRLGSTIQKLFENRQQQVHEQRVLLASSKYETFVQNPSWQANFKAVESFISIGDLLNAPFGRRRIDPQLTRELENISDIATCLYTRFSEVNPILRLNWAEQLSQFDEAIRLRNLATLPNWEEIDFIERRQMQALTDWLYGRINPTISEAQALMDDTIRVCILLASHAPVDQITAGEVEENVTIKPGGLIKLAIDPNKVRIGHKVLLFDRQKVIGQAIVQNMEATFAAAEIVQAVQPDFVLQKGAKVQIGGSTALKRNPITRQSKRGLGF